MTELYPTSKMLGEIISFGCSPNKAVVGENAFAHESGIHQHGVLANPLTYEIMTPASVGFTGENIVLGKHSGRRALEHRLADTRPHPHQNRARRRLHPLHRTSRPQKIHLRPGHRSALLNATNSRLTLSPTVPQLLLVILNAAKDLCTPLLLRQSAIRSQRLCPARGNA